jgi:hypothetical protein
MPEKNNISNKYFVITDKFIDKFILRYGNTINNLVLENGGDARLVNETLSSVILEIYYRIKYDAYNDKIDNNNLVKAITFRVLEDMFTEDKRSADLILNAKVLDLEKCKLFIKQINFNGDDVASALKNIGEPGRTALKLSFFNYAPNDEVVAQIQSNSIEEMNNKRMRFLDKCVQLLKNNG